MPNVKKQILQTVIDKLISERDTLRSERRQAKYQIKIQSEILKDVKAKQAELNRLIDSLKGRESLELKGKV